MPHFVSCRAELVSKKITIIMYSERYVFEHVFVNFVVVF